MEYKLHNAQKEAAVQYLLDHIIDRAINKANKN